MTCIRALFALSVVTLVGGPRTVEARHDDEVVFRFDVPSLFGYRESDNWNCQDRWYDENNDWDNFWYDHPRHRHHHHHHHDNRW